MHLILDSGQSDERIDFTMICVVYFYFYFCPSSTLSSENSANFNLGEVSGTKLYLILILLNDQKRKLSSSFQKNLENQKKRKP